MVFKYGPYSPSRLETGICGYAFNKLYIKDSPKRHIEGLAQARGSAVHEVLEAITRRMLTDTAVLSEAEIRRLVVEAVTRHPAAYQEVDVISEMAKLYLRQPPAQLTRDAEVELKLAIKPRRNPDGSLLTYQDTKVFETPVERIRFEECSYDDAEAWARGRADIMCISDDTTTAMIYDHKTQPNVEEADTFQMGFYAWVISRIYPYLSEIHTVLHFARYGKYSQPYVWTQQDLYKIEDMFLTRAAAIEGTTEWVAVPHKNCQYCPFIAECPIMSEFITIDERGARSLGEADFRILGNQHRAVKVAGLVNVLEEAIKFAKKELREFVNTSEGRVAIPGKIYEYRAEEGIDWDRVNKKLRLQVYEVFAKYGVDPKTFMGFSQTSSKHIWMMENEALLKELSLLFPRKPTSEFRGYTS